MRWMSAPRARWEFFDVKVEPVHLNGSFRVDELAILRARGYLVGSHLVDSPACYGIYVGSRVAGFVSEGDVCVSRGASSAI